MMKRILALLFIVSSLALSQSTLTLKEDFTAANGTLVNTLDSVGFPLGQTPSTAGGQTAGSGDQMEAYNTTLTSGTYGWIHWRRKYITDSLTFGMVIKQKWTSPDANPADAFAFGMLSDTNITTANGWLLGATYWTGTQMYLNIYRYTAGSYEVSQSFLASVAVNDTLKFRMMRDSMQIFVNSTFVGGKTDTRYHYGAGATYQNQYPVIRLSVQNTMPRVDKWMFGRHPSSGDVPAPPPTSDSYAPLASLTATPSAWDTSTNGSFTAVVTDTFAIQDIVVSVDTGGGYFGLDSVKALNTTTPGIKNYTFSTRNLHVRTAKVISARVLTRDSTGNVGYASTISITVGVGSSSGSGSTFPIFSYMPGFGYSRVNPTNIPWRKITHIVQFTFNPTTAAPYVTATGGTADSANYVTGRNTGGTWYGDGANPYFIAGNTAITNEVLYRDSCAANGVKNLLGLVCLAGGSAAIFNTNILDTTTNGKQDVMIQRLIAYIKAHYFHGIDINLEYAQNNDTYRQSFNRFARIMRDSLNTMTPHGVFTMSCANWYLWTPGNVNTPHILASTINNYIDYYNLEVYGYNASNILSLNAPIYKGATQTWLLSNGSTPTWIDFRSVNEAITGGVNPSKIGMLFGFESKRIPYTTNTTYPQPVLGAPIGGGNFFVDFQEVVNFLNANPVSAQHWDSAGRAPWVANNGQFYSYEDSLSIYYKVQYGVSKGVGAFGYWDQYRAYLYSLTGENRHKQPNWLKQAVNALGVVSTPPPSIPVRVSPTSGSSVDKSSVTLTWNTVSGATYYYVAIFNSANQQIFPPGGTNITDTTYLIPSSYLAYSSNYTWYVGAGNGTGISGVQPSAYLFTTQGQAVGTPATPVLTSPAANATGVSISPTFYWNRVDSAVSYNFQYTTDTTNSGSYITYSPLDTTISLVNLNNGVTYFWRVRGYNGTNFGSYSGFRKLTIVTSQTPTPITSTSDVIHPIVTVDTKKNKFTGTQFPFVSVVIGGTSQLKRPPSGWVNFYPELGILINSDSVVSQFVLQNNLSPITFNGLIVSGTSNFNNTINTGTATFQGTETHSGEANVSGSFSVLSGGSFAVDAEATFISGSTIVSSAPQGEPPFSTTSTTVSPNLNADLLDGQSGSYYAPNDSISRSAIMNRWNSSPETLKTRNYYQFTNGTNYGYIEAGSGIMAIGSANSGEIQIYGPGGVNTYYHSTGLELSKTWGDTLEGHVVGVVDSVNRTGLTTTIAAQNMIHINHASTADGLYEVSYYGHTTTASGSGSPTAKFLWAWNDGTSKTDSSSTWSLNATDGTGYIQGSFRFWRDSGTPTWGISVLGAAGSPVYSIHINVRKVQQ
jgi:GH18 family chitinase